MQQGTGKTKVIIDDGAYNFQQGNITGMLVLCPNGVKDTWLEELETHLPEDIVLDVFVWGVKTRHKAKDWILRVTPGERPFRVFIMNIEALSGEIGTPIAELFLARHTCLMVVDEFTRIKSPSASRTKNCLKLGKKAPKRRILSGTVITQAPLDIYTPFKFLDPQILGFSSIYSMRNRHATLGGFQGRQIIGYVKVEELQEKIKPVSYRKLRSECLDLPGKIYEKITVELNPKQRELYNQMASELKATIDWINPDKPTEVEVVHAITKIMRLQQIVGGFIPIEISGTKHPLAIPGDNPKVVALMDAIDDIPPDEKIVVWAHFHPELEILTSTLRKEFGQNSVTEFSGRIQDDVRQAGRRDFQLNTSGARFFIGQEQAGGMGLTLTASHLTYYYSNGQSLENRLQSEDRQDRIGQTEQVVVTDIVAKNSSDSRIVSGYRSKKRLADLVTGDPTLSWL
jgi:SNF2 family DNA or RNA helicase